MLEGNEDTNDIAEIAEIADKDAQVEWGPVVEGVKLSV